MPQSAACTSADVSALEATCDTPTDEDAANANATIGDKDFTRQFNEQVHREVYARTTQKVEATPGSENVLANAASADEASTGCPNGPSPFLDLTEYVSKTDLDDLDDYLKGHLVSLMRLLVR